MTQKNELPDIQHSAKPKHQLYINKVGVENVKVPIILETKYQGAHELIATVEMTADLRPDMKGISMSMLLRTLIKYLRNPLKHEVIMKILEEFTEAVESDSKHSMIKMDFDLPLIKQAPISKLEFPQYYKCSFAGKLDDGVFRFFQKVRVQYQSYCPCSASLCEDLWTKKQFGFPHAQRSFCDLLVEVKPENIIWLEELIQLVETAVTNEVYPILRRMDEQEVARIAAQNPMFVEDAIREIVSILNGKFGKEMIFDWIVKCSHEESLHANEAIAKCWKGVPNGFDGRYFL